MAVAEIDGFDAWRAAQEGRDLDPLAELLHRPAWMADAACRERPEIEFRSDDDDGMAARAKAVCGRCLVREDCLAWALAHDEPTGVWGSLTRQERTGRDPSTAEGISAELRALGLGYREIAAELTAAGVEAP